MVVAARRYGAARGCFPGVVEVVAAAVAGAVSFP